MILLKSKKVASLLPDFYYELFSKTESYMKAKYSLGYACCDILLRSCLAPSQLSGFYEL